MNVIDFFFFSCAVGLSEENLSIVEQERRTRSLTCGRHRSRDVLRVCAIDWGPVAIDEKFPGKISLTRCFWLEEKLSPLTQRRTSQHSCCNRSDGENRFGVID